MKKLILISVVAFAFSFNVKGGRCEVCEGAGMRTIEMNFLPDVYVHCEVCNGKRYNRETLEVKFRGHSIAEVLDMTVEAGAELFKAVAEVCVACSDVYYAHTQVEKHIAHRQLREAVLCIWLMWGGG